MDRARTADARRRFIADVAVLPRWIRVSQLLDYAGGVHPRFDRAKAEGFLARTAIKRQAKVRELSKGMVTQLHLALVMAVDARLLVLDEPTLGLDILYRKQFYDSLLNDYFDQSRTILVTTHQVEEIQDVLTDVVFINRGRIVFDSSMEQFESRYLEVVVRPDRLAAARALRPIHERQCSGAASCWSIRGRRSSATGRAGRGAHAEHRRCVRGGDGGARSDAMNSIHRLVSAARAVGEPFDLPRAADRSGGDRLRHRSSVMLAAAIRGLTRSRAHYRARGRAR